MDEHVEGGVGAADEEEDEAEGKGDVDEGGALVAGLVTEKKKCF